MAEISGAFAATAIPDAICLISGTRTIAWVKTKFLMSSGRNGFMILTGKKPKERQK